jgi:transposase
MLTVEEYGRIRRAHRDGMSVREIARTYHHSRRKVRQVLREAEPQPYTRREDPWAPKLGPLKPVIEAILKEDEEAPRKQRHTAAQIHRRLRDEHGYTGAYDSVRRHVRRCRRLERETFVPLSHEPGERVEVDFGHIAVDFPAGRRRVPVLMMTWSHSNYAFAIGLPTERVESVLHGMVAGFAFFGCVPREVWWDNPKAVVTEIGHGRERQVHHRYVALASHYVFEPLFCMAARPTEKPRVEGRVYDLQRRWATPVPRVRDLAELNEHLRRCCESERERTVSGRTESIGARFEADRQAALPLPERPFDPCVSRPGRVDKYQTVAFMGNRYSVPRDVAYDTVTVRAYVDRVEIVAGDRVVARHARSYGRDEHILEPAHYLATLPRRPAALDHAPVFRDWPKHPLWSELRRELETRQGRGPGARAYVRVLQLLGEHPEPLVRRAVEGCLRGGVVDAERIRQRVEVTALRAQGRAPMPARLDSAGLPVVFVASPDLGRFNELLSERGANDGAREHGLAVAGQPQATEVAQHPVRV